MVFTGLQPSGSKLLDACVIFRFRNRLLKGGLNQKQIPLINGQLQQRGLKVQGVRGTIIDATIIASAVRPCQHVQDQCGQAQVINSADSQAHWVKKNKQIYLGYRRHTAVDSQDGSVEHVQAYPANEAIELTGIGAPQRGADEH
jgi:IS5 family transposase